MFKDRYGLPLTTTSQKAAEHFVDGIDGILSFDLGSMKALGAAIEADDSFALPHAVRALQFQLRGDAAATKRSAQDSVDRVSGASAREVSFVRIVESAVAGGGARGGGAGLMPV